MQKKGYFVPDVSESGQPGPEALKKIHAFCKTPVEAEELYCFPVKLCDNEIDRDYERFSDEALLEMATLFVGKSGLLDHRWSAKEQVARLYHAEVVGEERRTSDGRPYRFLKGYAYMLRSAQAELVAGIEAGIQREVSVGLSCARAVCSVCGEVSGACGHVKGTLVDGKVCHAVLREPRDAFEWSFVAVPAQRGAGVLQKTWTEPEGLDGSLGRALEKAVSLSGEALGRLEKQAAWGQLYTKELQRDVIRLGGLCGLPLEVLDRLGADEDMEALMRVRDGLKAAVGKRYGGGCQLWDGVEGARAPLHGNEKEYRI